MRSWRSSAAGPPWPGILLLSLLLSTVHAQDWFLIRPPPDYFEPDVDTTSATPLPRVPSSPYGPAALICPTADGVPYSVGGFPGTPFLKTPFTEQYREPPVAQPVGTVCRTGDSHCMKAYELEIRTFQARPWDSTVPACRAQPATWLMGYNGITPGPTIKAGV
jgi:hypothetical protein